MIWTILLYIGIAILIIYAVIYGTKISKQHKGLVQEIKQLESHVDQLVIINDKLRETNEKLTKQRDENEKYIGWQESQITSAKTSLDVIQSAVKDAEKGANARIGELVHKAQEEYEYAKFEAQQDYLHLQETLSNDTKKQLDQDLKKLQELNDNINTQQLILEDLRSKAIAARTININREKEKDEIAFHQLQLSDDALHDSKIFRSLENQLSRPDTINKLIWKLFYEKPYTSLVGRVLGEKQHTGVYKITEVKSGKTYVGQAVDVAERWRQHIKRGLGAEPITQNKLYPAMHELGPENFTFELIEDCPREKLNERERYWIDFYGGKEFGYNVTGGNK